MSELGATAGSGPQDTSRVLHFEPFDTETAMNTLLEGLPKPPTFGDLRGELQFMPEGNRDSAWQGCHRVVEKHDRDLCQAYREQIDTLLVFAGLFSAVVTAFSIESYQWLQDDPADTSVALLRDMVLLMAQTSNKTVQPSLPKAPSLSDDVIVRINIFWFVSLCLSLSAALVGILCKQWLREYERDGGLSPEKALAVRHVRFQGLEYWKVGTIVTSVPIILQLALALFLLGIVDLLWRLHAAVAGCVTAVAGLTLAFYLLTTFLPLIQYAYICLQCCRAVGPTGFHWRVDAFTAPQCAFKSAQAWIVVRIAQPVIEYCLRTYAHCFTYHFSPEVYPLELPRADSWVRFDLNWTRRREHLHWGPGAAYETLAWAVRHLDEAGLSAWIWHCIWARCWGNLGRRRNTSDPVEDIDCVADAYPRLVRLGPWFPAHVRAQSLAFQCSLRVDLPADTAIELLLRVSVAVGVNSRWTQAALDAVVALYDGRRMHISDDLAMGLLDLAERQSCEQSETEHQVVTDPHFPVYQIARLLSRYSRLRGRVLPAMCALGVPWLGVQSRDLVKLRARDLLALAIDYYIEMGYNDRRQLCASPGVLLVARFASIATTIWPDFLRWWSYQPPRQTMLFALLTIWSTREGNPAPAFESPFTDRLGVPESSPERLVSNFRNDERGTEAVPLVTVHETPSATSELGVNAVAEPSPGPTAAD